MYDIRIKSINPETDRVRFAKAMLRYANLGLVEARQLLDRLLDGQFVVIRFMNKIAADSFVEEATSLGAAIEEETHQSQSPS